VANGSLVQLSPSSHPRLFRAAKLSVGRLGIITRLKMRWVRTTSQDSSLKAMTHENWQEAKVYKRVFPAQVLIVLLSAPNLCTG
jgi:hypothetical protein